MSTYRECLIEARKARLEGDSYEASRWLFEAMVSRIDYLQGPVVAAAFERHQLEGQL